MSELGKRYARAIVNVVAKDGDALIEKTADALDVLATSYATSSDLQQLVKQPGKGEQRLKVFQSILERVDAPQSVMQLIRVLNENNRLQHLAEIATSVRELANERTGQVLAEVTSAVALTDAQKDRLQAAIEARSGKNAQLIVHVDKNLLGGLVCRIGDLTIDTTVRRQLDQLREELETGVSS